jgi:hypothetical protein
MAPVRGPGLAHVSARTALNRICGSGGTAPPSLSLCVRDYALAAVRLPRAVQR